MRGIRLIASTALLLVVSVYGTSACGSGEATAGAVCPISTEPNSRQTQQAALASPPWVETQITLLLHDPGFDFTRLQTADDPTRAQIIAERQAQLAPQQGPVMERLRALGAHHVSALWLADSVFATLAAAQVQALACWPEVEQLQGNAPTSCGPGCPGDDPCAGQTTCGVACAPVIGDVLDVARGCVRRGRVVACRSEGVGESSSAGLTCSVRTSSGETFATTAALPRDSTLRPCARAEGGEISPAQLPECP